jgi:hypothetical protein
LRFDTPGIADDARCTIPALDLVRADHAVLTRGRIWRHLRENNLLLPAKIGFVGWQRDLPMYD